MKQEKETCIKQRKNIVIDLVDGEQRYKDRAKEKKL